VNFIFLKKSVPFCSLIHENRLKTGLHAGNDGFVDVSLGKFPGSGLYIEFFEFAVLYLCDPAFRGINGVNDDFTAHK
jgi:hypothetical protein